MRMKNFFIHFLLTFILAGFSISSYGQTSFGKNIYVPSNVSKDITEVVNDMAYWLQRATAQNYNITQKRNENGEGIHLQWLESSDLPVNIKNQVSKDGQSFYL